MNIKLRQVVFQGGSEVPTAGTLLSTENNLKKKLLRRYYQQMDHIKSETIHTHEKKKQTKTLFYAFVVNKFNVNVENNSTNSMDVLLFTH